MYITEHHPDMEAAIRECFATDTALLQKWHIAAPSTLDECVERTMFDIRETFDLPSLKFYAAYVDSVLAGYWGTEFGNYVNLVFVKPKFRHPEFMKEFWDEVKKTVSSPFYSAVYSKNEPAVKFYSRHASDIKYGESNGDKFTVFEFNKTRSRVCH